MADVQAVDEVVPIEFDQSRRLFFNLKSIRALDRAMGEVGLLKVLELLQGLNFTTLDRTLWAGLLHEEPNLTLSLVQKRVETYIDNGGDAAELFLATVKALNASKVFKQSTDQGNSKPELTTTT